MLYLIRVFCVLLKLLLVESRSWFWASSWDSAPKDPSLVPRIHVVERRKHLPHVVLWCGLALLLWEQIHGFPKKWVALRERISTFPRILWLSNTVFLVIILHKHILSSEPCVEVQGCNPSNGQAGGRVWIQDILSHSETLSHSLKLFFVCLFTNSHVHMCSTI